MVKRLPKVKKIRSDVETRGTRKLRIDDLVTVTPLTHSQAKTFTSYKADKNLLLHGIAGTGKTFLSLCLALEEVMDPSSDYDRVIIVRSIVPTRDIGFLKGDDKEKVSPYEAPYITICSELFNSPSAYDQLVNQGVIEFLPTSFIRGQTFDNSIIVVDECQNLNFHELDSIITRIGNYSKVIFCGDHSQSDFTKDFEKKGILSFIRILKNMGSFDFIEFTIDDIVRSELVKEYIITKYKLNIDG